MATKPDDLPEPAVEYIWIISGLGLMRLPKVHRYVLVNESGAGTFYVLINGSQQLLKTERRTHATFHSEEAMLVWLKEYLTSMQTEAEELADAIRQLRSHETEIEVCRVNHEPGETKVTVPLP